nr:uncharacterized protein LOC109174707 [Ipomoea trifida]
MTSRRINGSNTTPTYDGEDSCVFTIKLHIGGNLVWKPKVEYKDGFIEYFDHFNCDEGSLLDLRRMVKQLRFADKKVQFWVKVKGRRNTKKIELRKVTTDADILVLNLEVPSNKELDIYVEHLYDDQWDYEVEISRSLGDDALMTDEGDECSEQNSEREVDGPDNEFQDKGDEVDVEVNGPTLDKDGFTGNVLKQKLWGVCKATTEAEFKRQMEELKLENEKAAEWLAAKDPKHYCRAFFSTFPKSDMLLNNLCESWNSTILSFRDKPLMTMCDKIRLYLMARMQKNRDKMKAYPHKICPKISKCLEEAKEKSARYSTYKSTENLYQVDDHNFKAFKVDLAQRQCSCRGWDLTGIPCSHVVASIRKQRESPEDFVHQCYTVDSYLRAYEPAILPIQSSELWHKVDLPAPLPPKYKAQPGRPKKKRKIDPVQESKQLKRPVRTKKVGEVKRCRVCGMTGHNKTTCKGKNPQVEGHSEGQAEVEGQSDVEGQAEVEGHYDVEGQADVQGQSDVEGQADVQGQFEDVQVETQVPEFVLDELGSQEILGSSQSQTVHNQVPQQSSFIASHTTSSSANDSDMLRIGQRIITTAVLQRLARPTKLILIKKKQ